MGYTYLCRPTIENGVGYRVNSLDSTPVNVRKKVLSFTTQENRHCNTHQLYPKGKIRVSVEYQKAQMKNLDLYVVDSEGPALFSREWIRYIKLNW